MGCKINLFFTLWQVNYTALPTGLKNMPTAPLQKRQFPHPTRSPNLDLALNNLQRLICHKTQQTNQPTNQPTLFILKEIEGGNWRVNRFKRKQDIDHWKTLISKELEIQNKKHPYYPLILK